MSERKKQGWDIPFLGVGVAWEEDEEYIDFITRDLDPSSTYLEVHLPTPTAKIPKNFPIVAHCSTLGLADLREPSPELLADAFHQAQRLGAHWFGDHISVVGTTDGVRFGYLFPPVHDEGLEERVIQRVCDYRERYGMPIVIELGPRYSPWGERDALDDYRLLRNISVGARTPIILDIPHTTSTANSFGMSFESILDELDGAHVMELHIGASGILNQRSSMTFEDRWRQVEICLERFPQVRGITVELGRNVKLDRYRESILRVTEKLQQQKSKLGI
ncbi:DUF692 family multinuclear iron-containing protein [Tumebacillus lipolyticus]|uniref:DUF692 family multinuclear iron-containing protein n=1 Tax=Tumebacillus lipolyticus TaxID=1280370 RepID=A0ABW4ZY70_9BACL